MNVLMRVKDDLGEKLGKLGSLSCWQVAKRAAEGDPACLRLWTEYYAATKGRRAYELDERAAAAGKEQLALDALDGDEARDKVGVDAEAPEETKLVRLPVKTRDFWALRRLERIMPPIMAMVLRSLETDGPCAVAKWVAYAHQRCPSYSQPTSLTSTTQSRPSWTALMPP